MTRMEIVMNGEVVKTVEADAEGKNLNLDIEVPVERSSWIAARVRGEGHRLVTLDPDLLAHTSPLYCYVGGKPILSAESCRYYVDWIERLLGQVQNRGRFAGPSRRNDVMDLFRKAENYYESRLKEAETPG